MNFIRRTSPLRAMLLGSAWLAGGAVGTAESIQADDAMANYATNASADLTGSVIAAGPELFVGRKAYYGNANSNNLLHDVVPFQLPNLGPGTFTEVSVAIRAQGDSTWNIPINLWAISGTRATSATAGGDVRSSTQNHTQYGTLIMAGFFGRQTIRDAYVSTPFQGAEPARLAAWLNAAYQDGAGHGKFVFMRLSPQALIPEAAGPGEADSGFAVGAKGFVNAAWRPYLSYFFTPASAGAPVVNGFSVSDDEIGESDSTTLTWSVTGATSVEIWPDVGSVAATGSAVVTPGVTTTYTLYANNANGERVATTGVTIVTPPASEMLGELYDGGFRTDRGTGLVVGAVAALSEGRVDVGRTAGGTDAEHMVIPFKLPALGQGIFTNARLRMDVGTGDSASPGIDISLFGITEARALPTPLATDVNYGGQDHRSRGTLIDTDWINNLTPPGPIITAENSAGSVALSGWLTDAYANGDNGGKFVFLRLSPAALDMAQGNGVRVGTANHGSASVRPMITYDFVKNGLPPPAIGGFTASPAVIGTGWVTTLAWNVTGADTVSIAPGIGGVAGSGSVVMHPAASTTYTLTAANATGTRTRTVRVGVGPFRYFRFVPVTVRNGDTVQLAEFQLMKNGARLTGAVATNPAGDNPGPEGPEQANDNLTTTKWLDFNQQALVLDFGTATVADAYRFATANDTDTRDPVSWRVEGSHDGMNWRVLDTRTNFATPSARFTYIASLGLPFVGDLSGSPAAPAIDHFTASSAALVAGQSATLSWAVNGAVGATISPGIGVVAASGSLVVSPTATTTYSIAAGNASGAVAQSLRIEVRKAYRWFRFVPVKTRLATADAVALAEFGMLADGTPIPGATASNPGGVNPETNLAANATDDDFYTYWTDTNKQPLVLDFGIPVLANGYRFAIADRNPRDPVSWRIEGSANGSLWAVLDQQTDFVTPTDGEQFVSPFSLVEPPEPSALGKPPRQLFFTLPPGGSQATLVWESRPGATYTIETSATLAGGSWVPLEAGVPSGGAITSRAFSRGPALQKFYRIKENP
jgi:hypothetical protein